MCFTIDKKDWLTRLKLWDMEAVKNITYLVIPYNLTINYINFDIFRLKLTL